MITKNTTISIRFCADRFAVDPTHGIQFQIYDENGVPLHISYDTQGLCSIDDERIAGIRIGLTCIKHLFDNVAEIRNAQLKSLACEMSQITGAPVQCTQIPEVLAPTGMSCNLRVENEGSYENG
jgi:hypothetical protein